MQLLSDANNLKIKEKVYHLELGEPPQLTLLVKNEVKKLINSNLPGYTFKWNK